MIWPLPRPEEKAGGEADPLRRVHTLTRHVLAQLQSWLARPDTANTHLVIITRHAVSVSAYDGVPDLAHAAVWALIHTAQNEHPDRIILLDTDDTAATNDNLLAIRLDATGRRAAAGPAQRRCPHPPPGPHPDPDPAGCPRLAVGHHR